MSDLRISVVIPHLNQHEMLDRCLASLAAGRRRAAEVVVVDNGSEVLPEAVCARHGARLLSEATPGPGPARNCGAAATTGDVLGFIDADCIAGRDWLLEVGAAFEDRGTAVLGGDVRIARVDPRRFTALEAYESIYAYRMDRYIRREGFTGTGNLAVRREVMDEVGPFAGIDVAEDRDWGRRATAAGYAIRYVPSMRVYHPARRTFAELTRKWDRQLAHDFAETRHRRGGRSRWALRSIIVALSPLGEIPRVLLTDRVRGLRARLLASMVLVRLRLYRAKVMTWLLVGGDPNRLTAAWNRKA